MLVRFIIGSFPLDLKKINKHIKKEKKKNV